MLAELYLYLLSIVQAYSMNYWPLKNWAASFAVANQQIKGAEPKKHLYKEITVILTFVLLFTFDVPLCPYKTSNKHFWISWLIARNSELGDSGLGTETLHFVVTPMVPTAEGDSPEITL